MNFPMRPWYLYYEIIIYMFFRIWRSFFTFRLVSSLIRATAQKAKCLQIKLKKFFSILFWWSEKRLRNQSQRRQTPFGIGSPLVAGLLFLSVPHALPDMSFPGRNLFASLQSVTIAVSLWLRTRNGNEPDEMCSLHLRDQNRRWYLVCKVQRSGHSRDGNWVWGLRG